jgi:N-acetylglucosaminyl-diphospho-decaprenol L-rhamnosyltransferase
MTSPDASLVIVSWNSAGELPELLRTIQEHLGDAYELIVVDNASTDDSVEVARRIAPNARIVELEANAGYGAGCNAGTRAATGEVVALLNPDLVLVDDSLTELIRLARDEDAIFGPRLLNTDRTWQVSAFQRIASWELATLSFWPGPLMPRALRARCEPWRFERRQPVGWLSGACLVARRSLLLDLGPFDERLHMYGEDIDLCLRAQSRGAPTVFAPSDARVIHIGHKSAGRRFNDRGLRAKIAARAWAVRKNRGRAAAALDWSLQLGIVLGRLAAKGAALRDTSFERIYVREALRRPTAIARAGQDTVVAAVHSTAEPAGAPIS